MDQIIAWIISNFGAVGVLGLGGFFAWRDFKAEQRRQEERYLDAINKMISSNEISRDKYVELATTTIKALSDVHTSNVRVRDLMDERLPPGGR